MTNCVFYTYFKKKKKLTFPSASIASNKIPESVNPESKAKFSDIVKANKSFLVVLKPKNASQSRSETVNEIKTKLDPKCIAVDNIRGAAKTQKLKYLAQTNFGENYAVNVSTSRFPMLRVVGISSLYSDEE